VTGNNVTNSAGYVQLDAGSDPQHGAYMYTGTNSGCEIGNRIYAVMNKYYTGSGSGPNNQHGAYQVGVLYALQISNTYTQTAPGVAIAGRLWFNSNNDSNGQPMQGPSGASPTCSPSPDYGVFTDFGSTVPGSGPQESQAGVLAVTDCQSPVWTANNPAPAYCQQSQYQNSPNFPFVIRYALNLDPNLSGCNPAGNCLDYIDANFPWDYYNNCLWVRPHQTSPPITQMFCLTSGASLGLPTLPAYSIDVGQLGKNNGLGSLHPDSDAEMTTASDTGDSIMIIGTEGRNSAAVLAIDTKTGLLYWYYEPYSPAGGMFGIAKDQYGNPNVWFADTTYGNYAIGDCGRANQEGCLFPE